MRVDLRGFKALMSEQFLNVPQRCAASEQVSGAAVPEGVNRRIESGGFGVDFNDLPDSRIAETLAVRRKPERGRIGDDAFLAAFALSVIHAVHQFDSRSGDVFFDPIGSVFRERHDAPASTFAFADLQSSPVEVA